MDPNTQSSDDAATREAPLALSNMEKGVRDEKKTDSSGIGYDEVASEVKGNDGAKNEESAALSNMENGVKDDEPADLSGTENGSSGTNTDDGQDVSENTSANENDAEPFVATEEDKNYRVSLVHDMATGKKGGARGQHAAVLRRVDSQLAVGSGMRRRNKIVQQLQSFQETITLRHGEHAHKHTPTIHRQYRLRAVHNSSQGSFFPWLHGIGIHVDERVHDDVSHRPSRTWSANQFVIKYLRWTFRSSFTAVFASAAAGFSILCLLFAVPLWLIGMRHPACIGGLSDEKDYFTDAFMLSWTTFSTVGYGLVYSGISSSEPNIQKCTGITIIVTLEAFVGVLFASFCGAIVFGKIAKVQSFAQVTFSDAMVVRYGKGIAIESNPEDKISDDEEEEIESMQSGPTLEPIPCPILEFRVINHLSKLSGGEILDATVNIVASIDPAQIAGSLRNATRRRRRKKGKKGGRVQKQPIRKAQLPNSVVVQNLSQSVTMKKPALDKIKLHASFKEDPTGHLIPGRVFAKLELESPDHPFFKRSWTIRHTLDDQSPLLRAHARQMVQQNGGFWPKELNNAAGVREAFDFDHILVSMSGISNADANSVYAQKIYQFGDVHVGYRFANVLYRDPVDNSLQVDRELINDVTEQFGGGAEKFNCDNRGKNPAISEMLVL